MAKSKKNEKTETVVPTMLMTAKQMSKVSGIGENTLRTLMAEGKLEYLQLGSHRLIRKKAIKEYYERYKTPVKIGLSPNKVQRSPEAVV